MLSLFNSFHIDLLHLHPAYSLFLKEPFMTLPPPSLTCVFPWCPAILSTCLSSSQITLKGKNWDLSPPVSLVPVLGKKIELKIFMEWANPSTIAIVAGWTTLLQTAGCRQRSLMLQYLFDILFEWLCWESWSVTGSMQSQAGETVQYWETKFEYFCECWCVGFLKECRGGGVVQGRNVHLFIGFTHWGFCKPKAGAIPVVSLLFCQRACKCYFKSSIADRIL